MARLSTLSLAAAILMVPVSAHAAERHRLNVPAGRLGDALVSLGRQARVSIGISDPALANRRMDGLQGSYTAEQALRLLLRGSGARYVAIGPEAFRIVRGSIAAPNRRPAYLRARPAAMATAAPPPPAPPQPDIVVTGSKRATRLSVYPGTVDLLDGDDDLLSQGLRGSDALVQRLSTINSTHLGSGRNKLFLRGIADSSFNGPTQSTVGQYLGETRLNYNAPDPDLRLYDVERVEVLLGPQGTLYGAGSLGGIVRVLPNPPELDAVSAEASAGGTLTEHGDPGFDAAATLNLPISADRLGARIVAYGASEGGYIDDRELGRDDVNRTDIVGGRATLRAIAEGGWTIDLGGTWQSTTGEAQFADRDAPPLTRFSPVAQDFSNDYVLGDLVVRREWDDMRFVSATGIVHQVLDERYDSTRNGEPPTVYDQENRITLLSSDNRLTRQGDNGSGWLIGASLVRNVSEQSRALGPPEAPRPITGVRNAVTETTLYGEASFHLGSSWVATGGGRVTYTHLSGEALDAPFNLALSSTLRGIVASRSETAFMPSFSLSGWVAPELFAFIRYQQGYRPGGLAVSGAFVQRFESDHVATAEAGLRYGRRDRGPLDLAVSVSYTRWTDIQADLVDFSGMPTTANIGDGRIYTLDLRAGWRPVDGLELELAGTFNDSRVTNPLPTIIITPAAPLPNVAEVNLMAAANYATHLSDELLLRLDAVGRYVGPSRLGIGPVLGEEQGDWLDVSLGARLEFGRHAVLLGVTNLFDAVGNRFAVGSPFRLVDQPQVTPLAPRRVRLGWEVRF